MSAEIPIEKAKHLFLKYFRICGDFDQSKESSNNFCDKFITAEEEVDYWKEVKAEIDLIEQ
jgi:hypothetical protein